MFSGVALVSAAVTATTASDTQDAFMAPASSPGNVTARRVGVDSSATRVSSRKASLGLLFKCPLSYIFDRSSSKVFVKVSLSALFFFLRSRS